MSIFLTIFPGNVLPVLQSIGKQLLQHVWWMIWIVSGELTSVTTNNSFASYDICHARCNVCSSTWQNYRVT